MSVVVVDTSALVAIFAKEPERNGFLGFLGASRPMVSAGTSVETFRTIQARFGSRRLDDVQELFFAIEARVVPVDEAQVLLAIDGMMRFGKGRAEEPAVLNFGDLFAYALARHLPAPLLFKGDDFSRTDVVPAVLERGP